MSTEPQRDRRAGSGPPPVPGCCAFYHEAVELIGRRWTGAIVAVLIDHGPLRFSELRQAVPGVSDRLLSERVRELEARGVVARTSSPGRRSACTTTSRRWGASWRRRCSASANGRAPGWPDAAFALIGATTITCFG